MVLVSCLLCHGCQPVTPPGNEELVASLMGEGRVLGGLTAQVTLVCSSSWPFPSFYSFTPPTTLQGANIEGPGHIRAHTNLQTWIGGKLYCTYNMYSVHMMTDIQTDSWTGKENIQSTWLTYKLSPNITAIL